METTAEIALTITHTAIFWWDLVIVYNTLQPQTLLLDVFLFLLGCLSFLPIYWQFYFSYNI